MRTFKGSDLKTFEQILQMRQDPLKKVLSRFLKKHYPKVVTTKEYIFAEGDIPIALVAHMDTVFKDPPTEIFFDQRHNAMISPQGLGADDRAGIFAILQIVRSGLKPHIIFTTDEEQGGVGAYALSKLKCPFTDLRYMIELDRRGADDCVFYDCENPEFIDYVEEFGFTYSWGSFSDICYLCPAWGVAGVNLSIGYRDEHSYTETLFVGQMFSTIDKVKRMLTAKSIPFFKYIEAPMRFKSLIPYGYGFGIDPIRCGRCKQFHMEEETFPVIRQDGTTTFYCPDCLSAVAWCSICDSAYEKYAPDAPDFGTCPKCLEQKEKKTK